MVSGVGFLELLPRGTLCLNKTVLVFVTYFNIDFRYDGMLFPLFVLINLGWILMPKRLLIKLLLPGSCFAGLLGHS